MATTGYVMAPKDGGGFAFTGPTGQSLSALGYARGTGTDFYDLLQSMGAQGDTYASQALQYNTGPTADDERAMWASAPYGFQGSGLYDLSPLTWGEESGGVLGSSTGGGSNTSGAIEQFNTGKSNVLSSANTATDSFVGNQRNNILDLLDSFRTSQKSIDDQRISAEIGKQRGYAGILDMMGRGIRSGGVMLANRNAGDSSAAGAIARAYGEVGQRERSGVDNQYSLDQRELDTVQSNFNNQRASSKRGLDLDKQNLINSLVGQAEASFAALNQAAAGAGISERIQIEQEKENLRQQVLAQLSQLDQEQSQLDMVNPMDQAGVLGEAQRLNQAGQGGNNYLFNTEAPANWKGPQLGQLPVYSSRRSRWGF